MKKRKKRKNNKRTVHMDSDGGAKYQIKAETKNGQDTEKTIWLSTLCGKTSFKAQRTGQWRAVTCELCKALREPDDPLYALIKDVKEAEGISIEQMQEINDE